MTVNGGMGGTAYGFFVTVKLLQRKLRVNHVPFEGELCGGFRGGFGSESSVGFGWRLGARFFQASCPPKVHPKSTQTHRKHNSFHAPPQPFSQRAQLSAPGRACACATEWLRPRVFELVAKPHARLCNKQLRQASFGPCRPSHPP